MRQKGGKKGNNEIYVNDMQTGDIPLNTANEKTVAYTVCCSEMKRWGVTRPGEQHTVAAVLTCTEGSQSQRAVH